MKIELDKDQIGERLREFGVAKFGNVTGFAKAMGHTPSSFQAAYLSGRSLPGSPMIAHLLKLGCDIHWLYFGSPSPGNKVDLDLEAVTRNLLEKKSQLERIQKIISEGI